MISTADFLSAVNRIVESDPVYRTGGTGDDGTCDCIGLVMGAMYRNGRENYDMHSSNYFARFQTDDLQMLKNEAQLDAGMVVYKARNGADRLHQRYLTGGRYHTGDLLDYYHAGVVLSACPLRIVHCTSDGSTQGIKQDDTMDGWTHCGHVKGVERTAASGGQKAVVTAPSGSTVNLRMRPDETSPVLARIPVGSSVVLHETADGWARITAGAGSGYMMTAFLTTAGQQQEICVPRETLRQIIRTLESWL